MLNIRLLLVIALPLGTAAPARPAAAAFGIDSVVGISVLAPSETPGSGLAIHWVGHDTAPAGGINVDHAAFPAVAAGSSLVSLVSQFSPGSLADGTGFHKYLITVGNSVQAFISSITFDSKVIGIRFIDMDGGNGAYVLGVQDKTLILAGESFAGAGLALEVFTANPEPGALLVWAGLLVGGLVVGSRAGRLNFLRVASPARGVSPR